VPLDYERGPHKVWVYGALCVRDGQVLIQTASSRDTTSYLTLLQTLDRTDAHGAVEQGRIAAYNMICAPTERRPHVAVPSQHPCWLSEAGRSNKCDCKTRW
jgi:hypothetical protein